MEKKKTRNKKMFNSWASHSLRVFIFIHPPFLSPPLPQGILSWERNNFDILFRHILRHSRLNLNTKNEIEKFRLSQERESSNKVFQTNTMNNKETWNITQTLFRQKKRKIDFLCKNSISLMKWEEEKFRTLLHWLISSLTGTFFVTKNVKQKGQNNCSQIDPTRNV